MLTRREIESEKLKKSLEENISEFIVVSGCRRVSKIHMNRETFNVWFTFYHTGSANISRKN